MKPKKFLIIVFARDLLHNNQIGIFFLIKLTFAKKVELQILKNKILFNFFCVEPIPVHIFLPNLIRS